MYEHLETLGRFRRLSIPSRLLMGPVEEGDVGSEATYFLKAKR
jgi:hypothetical protein